MNTLQTDLITVFERLTQFATQADFWQRFETIYGKEYDADLAEALRSQWARGDFSQLPAIEVLRPEVLGDAVGAYAASLNKIYLSESFLATATLAQITAVILEEIGHFVDAQINTTDRPGDEGELFAALVLGSPLSPAEEHRIRHENDLCTVTIAGQEVALEQASAIKSGIFPTAGSDPGNLTNVNGTLYFTADDAVNGRELWKSDDDGTVLVKDIWSGSNSSFPSSLTSVNATLYFTAYDGINGSVLWTSNGTPEGTIRISDSDSFPLQNLIIIDGILYFTADDGVNGQELWKSDSIGAGRVLVKDIWPGVNGSSPENLTNVNGTLYFFADDGIHGRELWKSDGTPERTILVEDSNPSSDYFNPENLTSVKNTLYFTADNGVNGRELWKSDGTPQGTGLIKDINSGANEYGVPFSSNLWYLTNVNGSLYFIADDGIHGEELWKSDGTPEGTILVKDIGPGSDSGVSHYYHELVNVNGTLYFTAYDGISGGLWKSDGTPEGTIRIKENFFGDYLTNVDGTLYFTAYDDINGQALWKSDGTPEGTFFVKKIWPWPWGRGSDLQNLTAVDSVLYFTADDDINGQELWKSNGTTEGTILVKNINPSPSQTPSFVKINQILYFNSYDEVLGWELWRSDGTAGGTVLVKDIAGYGGSNPEYLTNLNGVLYFQANDGFIGYELWKSDGTPEGTVLVKDIAPGPYESAPRNLTNVNENLYFAADDVVNGRELWKSDGTAIGTVLVKDINSTTNEYGTPFSSDPEHLTNINGILYFTANDGVNGRELWKSDGTTEGTFLIKDIHSGPDSSSIYYLTNINGILYFTASDGVNGPRVWKSDGTSEGTIWIKEIFAGHYLTNVNDTLYFTACDGINGQELWQSNGTAVGTVLVKDINSGANEYGAPFGSNPEYLINVNGTLYFTANDGVNGRELWKSDGTTAGTVLVKDIVPGSNYVGPDNLIDVNGTLYFTADDGVNGRKIWTTDGTAAGTVIADTDLLPSDLVSFLGRLFFTAVDLDGEGRGLQALNQAPTDISLNKLTIGKNLPIGSVVSFLSTTDPDGDNAFSYSLVAGVGDGDNSAFTIDSNTLKLAVSPSDQTQASFSLRVKTTDQGGLSYEKAFTLTVTDNDEAGAIPSLSIQDVVMPEGHSGQQDLTFTVRLSQPSSQAVTVHYSTADQTAMALPDYDFTRGVLTIPAGETTGQINIPIRGDTLDEHSETFAVNLSNAIGATLLDSQAIGTIEQDDTPPLVFKGGMLQLAYVACYGRPGDPEGLHFWNKVFTNSKVVFGAGDPLTGDEVGLFNTLTRAFGEGPEATQLFGGLTSAQKVNKVYQMAFNRDAEPEGLNFWTGHLDAGNITPANLGLYVALSAVNEDIIILRNKIASADSMSQAINTTLERHAISTPAYADFGREWLALMGDTSASLYAADTALANSGLF